MKSLILFVLLLQAITNVVNLTTAQFPSQSLYRCRETGKYTTRSDYAQKLKLALNQVGNARNGSGGFFSSSNNGSEAVYAYGLCSTVSGKLGTNCTDCIYKLITSLIVKCPNQKEAVMWGSSCMVRYSDRKLFGVLDDWVWIHQPERDVASDKAGFNKALNNLATRLQGEASRGGASKKSALGSITYPPKKRSVYATMQCTPDLSTELCGKCLQSIILTHNACCGGKTAAKMFSPNCYFAYSLEDFSKWKPR